MLVHYIITINDLARMLKYRMLDRDLSKGRHLRRGTKLARHARTRLATSHGARADWLQCSSAGSRTASLSTLLSSIWLEFNTYSCWVGAMAHRWMMMAVVVSHSWEAWSEPSILVHACSHCCSTQTYSKRWLNEVCKEWCYDQTESLY